jgi:hypothetical protein
VVPPKAVVVAPALKGFEVVVVLPNAGLLAPKSPPPVFVAPNGDDVAVLLVAPNPPKPVVPVVAVPLPNNPPLLVVAVPNPDGFAPNALFVVVPKPPVIYDVSCCSNDLKRKKCA